MNKSGLILANTKEIPNRCTGIKTMRVLSIAFLVKLRCLVKRHVKEKYIG